MKTTKKAKNTKKYQKLTNLWAKFVNFFDAMLFPDNIKCIFCGRDINHFEEQPYCDECAKKLVKNEGNRCRVCDEKIENEAIICDHCQKQKRSFKRAYCPLIYEGIVRQSLISYKMNNKRYLAKSYAKFIYNYIGEDFKNFDVITYVPMTKKKEKIRSFNQAKILAEELAKISNLQICECLIKTVETKEQKNLNFKERKENLSNCFKIVNEKEIKGKRVLLVDDIITTCATTDTCSKLIAKYAKSVCVTSVARNILKEKEISQNIF